MLKIKKPSKMNSNLVSILTLIVTSIGVAGSLMADTFLDSSNRDSPAESSNEINISNKGDIVGNDKIETQNNIYLNTIPKIRPKSSQDINIIHMGQGDVVNGNKYEQK